MNLSSKIMALLLLCASILLIVWGVRSIAPPSIPTSASYAAQVAQDSAAATAAIRNQYPKYSKYPKYPKRTAQQYHRATHLIVEINSADSATLTKIRGIGPTFARRITTYRNRLGGFSDISQLLEIKGIDSLKLQEIEPQIKIDNTLCQKLDLATCPPQTIQNHPYISRSLSKRILKHRAPLTELLAKDIILPHEAQRLRAYFF